MNLKLVPFAAIAAIMATSCSKEEVMDINYDPDGKAITFTAGVGHSRAVETTVNNLGDFKVVAKGVHPHGGVYDSYLIGSSAGGDTARRELSSNTWLLNHNVYWPTSIDNALFWAYTFSQANGKDKSDILPTGVTFGFDATASKPTISNFTPAHADLTTTQSAGYWNDGDQQTDMLIAFTQQERSTNASNVALNFTHALCQVDIKAKSDGKLASDNRIVKIKGAWIVNTVNKNNFSAGFSWNAETKKATITPSWSTDASTATVVDGFSAYGSFYKTPIVLGKTYAETPKALLGSSLMIIPQTTTAWTKKADDKTGAYILLLCRVELEHPGTTHTGSDNIDDVGIHGTNHYHQQFPVNEENKFDASEYGFVCVPLGTKWEMGKKYVYTLDICGAESGAGVYPLENTDKFNGLIPTDKKFTTIFDTNPVDLKVVFSRPTNKHVGDYVLDEPIKFNVTVSPWANADSEWKPGNGDF